IALYTNHFRLTGDAKSLVGAHAALKVLDVSAHALESAADRLDWSGHDLSSLEHCKDVSAQEGGRWLQWLDRSLTSLAGSTGEPVDALLACALARLSAGSDATKVAEALPRSAA